MRFRSSENRTGGARALAWPGRRLLVALVGATWPGAAGFPRPCGSSSSVRPPRPRPPPAPARSSRASRSRPAGSRATSPASRRSPAGWRNPTWRRSKARSSPGRSPSPGPRPRTPPPHQRGRLLRRNPRQARGGEDRRPTCRQGTQTAPVHAGAGEPGSGAQPVLRQHRDLRPRTPAHGPPGPDGRPDRAHLGADVRLQRLGRRHLARQSPGQACSSKEDIKNGRPQQVVGKTKTYGCYYSSARLLYTATLVKKP